MAGFTGLLAAEPAPHFGGFLSFIVSLHTSTPKRTYGAVVKKRTLRVLKALIQFANLEATATSPSSISYRWLDRNTSHPKLIIQATLAELWEVCRSTTQTADLTQAEVRESLYALDKFLGILRDHRLSTQGSPHWHFTLELWSTRTDDNIAAADRLWQTRQAEKKAGLSSGRSSSRRRTPLSPAPQADWLNRYGRWFVKTYGQIKILPNLARRSIALDHIYVNVSVLAENGIKHLSAEDAETFADRFTSRCPLIDSALLEDGMSVAQRHPWLMVLGLPGCGKSTFLRKLGLEAIKTTQTTGQLCIPVVVELKLWSQQSLDLMGYIQQEIYRWPSVGDRDALTDHLRQGHLLVLLDGLDEVPPERLSNCIDQIRSFVKTFDANRYVMSCRTADYSYGLPRFVDVEVAGFSDRQIKGFIDNWFGAQAQSQEPPLPSLWKLLNRSRNLPIKELARSPLLLFYLCLVHETGISLPQT